MTIPTTKPHPTDQIPQLIARARAAEDERDALARKVVELSKRLNRNEPSEREAELLREVETLTRQLKRAALADADPRALDRAQAAIAALRDANVLLTHERERLLAANEALAEQVRVLRLANRTMANQERSA